MGECVSLLPVHFFMSWVHDVLGRLRARNPEDDYRNFVLQPANAHGVRLVVDRCPLPHQPRYLEWLAQREREHGGGLFCAQMGLGKTFMMLYQVVRTLADQRQAVQAPCYPTLYVCPSSLAGTVIFEAHKFFGPQLSILRLEQYHLGHDLALTEPAELRVPDVVIVSYQSVYRCFALLSTYPWYRIVLDESQYIRNPKTAMYKYLCRVDAPRRWGMTGTPMVNGYGDIARQLEFTRCLSGPRVHLPRRTTLAQLHAARFMDHCKFVDLSVLGTERALPRKQTFVHEVDWTAEERQRHGQLWRRLRGTLQSHMEPQTCLLKSLAFCSRSQAKLDMVLACMDQWLAQVDPGDKLVVMSFHEQTLTLLFRALCARDPQWFYRVERVTGRVGRVREREYRFDRFRTNPESRVLLMTTKVGGIGLNLMHAQTLLMLDPWWSPAMMTQAEMRIWRVGQEREVTVHYFLVRESAEYYMWQVAHDKVAKSDRLSSLRARAGGGASDLPSRAFVEAMLTASSRT